MVRKFFRSCKIKFFRTEGEATLPLPPPTLNERLYSLLLILPLIVLILNLKLKCFEISRRFI